ncbi:MAG: hypothetical protein IPQ07_34325 [Myxococcales bacterium]|nr:hypothetical protein [Myxococcales bacterium]
MTSFAEKFAPNEAELVTAMGKEVARTSPPGYLQEIGWTPGAPFAEADRLRASALHSELDRSGLAAVHTFVVCHAIRFSTSVDLAGDDPFEDDGYYARLHDAPYCQVAGTKNRFHFLDALFTTTWRPERRVYDYAARPVVAPPLRDLLDALFLSTRTFPGIQVLDRNATWPGYDDTWFQGLLAPQEVGRLASCLDEIAQLEAARDTDDQDELFPLFADRVRRAAAEGLALVTLHNGL